MTDTLEAPASGGFEPIADAEPPAGSGPDGPASSMPGRPHRHRLRTVVVCVLGAVAVLGAAVVVYQWRFAGPHEVSGTTALDRFRAGSGTLPDPGAMRPKAGVYSYRGHAVEHVSFPPLSHDEGPSFPGTVSYRSNGCWVVRLDYSDLHWQSTTYCPRGKYLVESGRAGWYRWNVGVLAVADTATFSCQEMAIPVVLGRGERYAFACIGTNTPIDTGTVFMSGTNQYLGTATVRVAGRPIPTLHFREVAELRGGQTGTSTADTWVSAVNGLPVKGTWSTTVRSPSPLGTSTLTGSGNFVLHSLDART